MTFQLKSLMTTMKLQISNHSGRTLIAVSSPFSPSSISYSTRDSTRNHSSKARSLLEIGQGIIGPEATSSLPSSLPPSGLIVIFPKSEVACQPREITTAMRLYFSLSKLICVSLSWMVALVGKMTRCMKGRLGRTPDGGWRRRACVFNFMAFDGSGKLGMDISRVL